MSTKTSAPVGAEDIEVLKRLRAALPDVGMNGWWLGVEVLDRVIATLTQQPEALAKYQPCGCVICTCEDEKQCQGCGAKHCGNRTNHPAYVKQTQATEIEALRELCGMAYQLAGVHDAPEKWLDALSNAAAGRPFSTDGLLPYMPQPAADQFIATFRCEDNGIVGTTDAKIHSVTRHDDGRIEVVIDHWPEQPAAQQQAAMEFDGTDREVLREFIRICREHKPVGQWPGERVCKAIERAMDNENPFRFIAEEDMAPEREPSMKDEDRALSGPRRRAQQAATDCTCPHQDAREPYHDIACPARRTHPAITHCDNCGLDWLDNGLNPVGCPYCKQRELLTLAEQWERDAAGCRRDGYIDAAVVKEDCAQIIRQTLGISAIAKALAAQQQEPTT